MSTTAPPPRFTRTSARGLELGLTEPLPPSLAALAALRAEQHRKVGGKLQELRARRVELARKVAEQETADAEEATQAAMENRNPRKQMRVAKLREQLEAAEAEIVRFETGLTRSADSLLEAAAPLAARAAEKAAQAQQAALARAAELLGALDSALEQAGNLRAEEFWLHRLHRLDGAKPRIEPFRVSGDPGLSRLRASLRDAFADWQAREEKQQAELDRQRAWEEEHAAEWARQTERAEQDSAAAKVRFEGMKLTHRGGHPVGPAGDFQEGEEELRP